VIDRRELLLGAAGLASGLGLWRSAWALGRTPLKGAIELALPFSLRSLDQHDPTDPMAAMFGGALFDTMVTQEKRGFFPALAEELPKRDAGATMLRLRPGLRTAKGKALDAKDVIASLKRARARGAGPLLDPLGDPTTNPKDPRVVYFPKAPSSMAVLLALVSPLTAIVPRDFNPREPDGTGPFGASFAGGAHTLTRNESAAMGASFLESLTVRESPGLRESLRGFEVGRGDLSWLGTGLFGGRANVEAFDLGAVAHVALVAPAGGGLGRAGALQRLLDDVPRQALGHLGLGALPAGSSNAGYDGAPIDLWVESSPYLVEVAQAIAEALSQKDHEITVRKTSREDVAQKRGRDGLTLGVIRSIGSAAAGLGWLEEPSRAAALLKTGKTSPREAARGLRAAVLGELRFAGGKTGDLKVVAADGGGWDLGRSFMKKKP
jgi:peptide/nickel transport system substrate-binding protein